MYKYLFVDSGAKVRISERKAKFICAFPSESTLDEVKVTNKRAENKEKLKFFFFSRARVL